MEHAQLGSAVLRPRVWLSNWTHRISLQLFPSTVRMPGEVGLKRLARPTDTAPTEVSHRFWHGLMFALPVGIGFWIGIYFLVSLW